MEVANQYSIEELYHRLTFDQFRVTQFGKTERPFDNEYHKLYDVGVYHCIVCNEALFSSETKFNSGTGWPSFWDSISRERLTTSGEAGVGGDEDDDRYVEQSCLRCGAHLGHRFPDAKTPTRQRYCINSASLRFEDGVQVEEPKPAP